MRRPIQPGIRTRPEEADDSEAAQLRAALREAAAHWPAGVAVVAVRDGGMFEAITVTAFVIASLEPPLVLASIGRHAAIVPLLEGAARFSVSFLAADQQRIAALVSDRVPRLQDAFEAGPDPLLKDAAYGLVCVTEDVRPAGDHRLFLARVERVVAGREAAPLLYHDRGYRRLAE